MDTDTRKEVPISSRVHVTSRIKNEQKCPSQMANDMCVVWDRTRKNIAHVVGM